MELLTAMEQRGVDFAKLAKRRAHRVALISALGFAVPLVLIGSFFNIEALPFQFIALSAALWIAGMICMYALCKHVLALANQGKYIQARRLSHTLMQISWKTFPYSPLMHVASAHLQLMLTESRFVEVRAFSRALGIMGQEYYVLPRAKQGNMLAFKNMEAICCMGLSQYAEATALFRQCLTTQKGMLRMILLYNIGVSELHSGNYNEAYIQLKLGIENAGRKEFLLCYIYPALALTCLKMGKIDEARPLIDESLNYLEKHSETGLQKATCYGALAKLRVAEGHRDEAEHHMASAVDLLRQHLSETHPGLRRSMLELAEIKESLGKVDEAAQLRQSAEEGEKRMREDCEFAESMLLERSHNHGVMQLLGML